MSTAVQSVNYRAAKAVALHVRDTAEARLFLDMLGLISGPRGRGILPDDSRQYDVPALGAVPAADPEGSPIALSVAAERGDRMTTPAGLRRLPDAPPTPPAAGLPEPTSEVTVPTPAPSQPNSRARNLGPISHGSPGGLRAHERRGETVPDDDPCGCRKAHRAAQAAYQRKHYEKTRATAGHAAQPAEAAPATPPSPTPVAIARKPAAPRLEPIEHGTAAGWRTHHARGALPPCEACDAAYGAERAAVSAVELDVWLAAAALSSSKSVQRAARAASVSLLQLHVALDELARVERAAARSAVAS